MGKHLDGVLQVHGLDLFNDEVEFIELLHSFHICLVKVIDLQAPKLFGSPPHPNIITCLINGLHNVIYQDFHALNCVLSYASQLVFCECYSY
jgi:hypothetical protein